MNDVVTAEQAIEAFHNLSAEDKAKIAELNSKVQNHEGPWGERLSGEKIGEKTYREPWVKADPLINEILIDFMYDKGLLIHYVWSHWSDDLAKLYDSEDPTKYDEVDLKTALILMSAAVRKGRGAGGSLTWAFESGGFPKLINRLTELTQS